MTKTPPPSEPVVPSIADQLRSEFEAILSAGYPNPQAGWNVLAQLEKDSSEAATKLQFYVASKLAQWDKDERATIALKNGNMGLYNEILNEV